MAIIWMDGPDHYGTSSALLVDGVYAEAGFISLVPNAGPGGIGTVFNVNGGNNAGLIRKVLPGNRALVAMGFHVYFANLPTSIASPIMEWRDNSNNIIAYCQVLTTGALEIIVGGSSRVVTAPVITANSWRHVEIKLNFNATTGSITIGVDSITIYDQNGLNTGSTLCAQVSARNYSTPGSTTYRFRDWYIWDSTGSNNNSGMQGDRQVVTTYPTADGPIDDWTPSTGSTGYNIISQVPPIDSTYIYADVDEEQSNFEMGDIDTEITSISAMMIVGRLAKSDAGIGTVSLDVSSSGDIGTGTELAITTAFTYYSQIFETDPHTSVKWTPLGINNALSQITRTQ